jgi:hypothetical protein
MLHQCHDCHLTSMYHYTNLMATKLKVETEPPRQHSNCRGKFDTASVQSLRVRLRIGYVAGRHVPSRAQARVPAQPPFPPDVPCRCGAMGQTYRHSHLPLAPPPRFPLSNIIAALSDAARMTLFVCVVEAFPVSRAAEVVGADDDDDHKTALQAVGRNG